MKKIEVKYTEKLGLFTRLKGNRPENPQHVSRLAVSFKKYGVLINPIIVNNKNEIIDGQHRVAAAKKAKTGIYYIVAPGYYLDQVHALNLNQTNWTIKEYLLGYSEMGIKDYLILKEFWQRHQIFSVKDCSKICANTSSATGVKRQKIDKTGNPYQGSGANQFNEGKYKVKDMDIAEKWAENIKMIKPYFEQYSQSGFVGAMLAIFEMPIFSFDEFLNKLKLQPTALVPCATRAQYRQLIEDIYNYRRRDKVNLRF